MPLVGAAADIVLFDLDRLSDEADYEHPTRMSQGLESVWVNGELAWANGAPVVRAGRVLGPER